MEEYEVEAGDNIIRAMEEVLRCGFLLGRNTHMRK